MLEGSVRKAGNRVRITAQLIDAADDSHVWAERYDRDLTDIFALQDEISRAIVGALKLKLLPQEKQAIGRRGTDSVEAYNLFLMARQQALTGNIGDARREESMIRMCRRALDIDPGYAQAWAMLAHAQSSLRYNRGRDGEDGRAAADEATRLDPTLAEPHAVRAKNLAENGHLDEAMVAIETALRLGPDSAAKKNAGGECHRRPAPHLRQAPRRRRTLLRAVPRTGRDLGRRGRHADHGPPVTRRCGRRPARGRNHSGARRKTAHP